jgi:hypothetical protein
VRRLPMRRTRESTQANRRSPRRANAVGEPC